MFVVFLKQGCEVAQAGVESHATVVALCHPSDRVHHPVVYATRRVMDDTRVMPT